MSEEKLYVGVGPLLSPEFGAQLQTAGLDWIEYHRNVGTCRFEIIVSDERTKDAATDAIERFEATRMNSLVVADNLDDLPPDMR